MEKYLLSIDQGTTSSRAIIFDTKGRIVSLQQQEIQQYYPQEGWVEHDPEEIWQTVVNTCQQAIAIAGIDKNQIIAAGITNQRETTVIWERKTGKPIYRAIVWQDRRTADLCEQLAPHAIMVTAKTGLLLDPYFSATKIHWILQQIPGALQRAQQGELAFGTIDLINPLNHPSREIDLNS